MTSHLTISNPCLSDNKDKSRLSCNVTEVINGENKLTEQIWIDVDRRYGEYLVDEVCDSFIVAVLPYAMLNNLDIHVESMSRELYHNITHQLTPVLSKYNRSICEIKIIVEEFKDLLFNGTEVGTGMTLGVDSFDVVHSYYEDIDSRLYDFKITSLLVNNNGSFGNFAERIPENKQNTIEKVGKELHLPVIYTNSNIHLWRTLDYGVVHLYRNIASVIAMAKYWNKYYYATGYEITEFDISKVEMDPARSELLFLNSFSYSTIKFYSPNSGKSRLDRTENIAKSSVAKKYLNSCWIDTNCGECEKCLRNILNLEAFSALNLFKGTINTEYWKNNREDALFNLIHDRDTPSLKDAFMIFKNENKYNFREKEKKYAEVLKRHLGYADPFYAYLAIDKNSLRGTKSLIKTYSWKRDYDLDLAIHFFKNYTKPEHDLRRNRLYM